MHQSNHYKKYFLKRKVANKPVMEIKWNQTKLLNSSKKKGENEQRPDMTSRKQTAKWHLDPKKLINQINYLNITIKKQRFF